MNVDEGVVVVNCGCVSEDGIVGCGVNGGGAVDGSGAVNGGEGNLIVAYSELVETKATFMEMALVSVCCVQR